MAEAAVSADAPGRVNLIGEHTDYNDGFVLPTATPQRTRAVVTPRPDATVAARAESLPDRPQATYQLGRETRGRGWLDYVQGVTHVLAQAGHHVGGFDLQIDSDVPVGSGLSSSAALEVSLLRALRAAFDVDLDDLALARLGQRAENEFVGARVGIMDQMAAVFADTGSALLIDTRSLAYQRLPLPEADLVVVHSGVAHGHAGGEYNARRADCEQACRLLGVPALRDLTVADLPGLNALPDRLRRRARHVITENDRVLRFVDALRAGDLEQLGALLYASHASLRDDYDVSVPPVDLLINLTRSDNDVYGARMTGGGFGGAVVMLARAGTGREVGYRLVSAYDEHSGERGSLLIPEP
jgi:galactokinase